VKRLRTLKNRPSTLFGRGSFLGGREASPDIMEKKSPYFYWVGGFPWRSRSVSRYHGKKVPLLLLGRGAFFLPLLVHGGFGVRLRGCGEAGGVAVKRNNLKKRDENF